MTRVSISSPGWGPGLVPAECQLESVVPLCAQGPEAAVGEALLLQASVTGGRGPRGRRGCEELRTESLRRFAASGAPA